MRVEGLQPPRSGVSSFDLAGMFFDTMLGVFVVEEPIDPPFFHFLSVYSDH